MFTTLKKAIKDLVTENDGVSYCPVRVFAFFLSIPTIVLFTVGGVLQIVQGHFDLQGFATAFATLSGGFMAFGLSVAAKALTDTKQ